MGERTTITVDGIVLRPLRYDWRAGIFTCLAWTPAHSALLRPLMQAMQARQRLTCHLEPGRWDSRLSVALRFTAYVSAWRCDEVLVGQHQHTITLTVDGPLWRDDDTPVDSHEALWDLMYTEPCGAKD